MTSETHSHTPEATVTLLRGSGLRVTGPRVRVIDELRRLPHADADTIVRAVRRSGTAVSTQAVYDVLKALTIAGIVRRLDSVGAAARYELHRHDNHHHLVCRSCGQIEDVECHEGEAPCLHPPGRADFAVDEAEVIYRGLCRRCQGL